MSAATPPQRFRRAARRTGICHGGKNYLYRASARPEGAGDDPAATTRRRPRAWKSGFPELLARQGGGNVKHMDCIEVSFHALPDL